MTIYQILIRDHRTVGELFKRLQETSGRLRATRARIFSHLRRELLAHTQAEEEVLYRAIKAVDPEAEPEIVQAIEDHAAIRGILSDLQHMPADDARWPETLGLLKDMVEAHVMEEENEFLERARRHLGPEQARELGQRMLARKSELMLAVAAEGATCSGEGGSPRAGPHGVI